ncbi:MAG: hypothetical protein U0414_07645 [Polyangiaceae bacterium]
MTSNSVLLAAFLIAGLSGCSSVPVMGTVRSAYACDPGELGIENLPLAHARVTIECPAGRMGAAETDRTGRFAIDSSRSVPMDCMVRITRDGYLPRTYGIRDVCASGDDERCFAIGIAARLGPATEAEVTLAPGFGPKEKQPIAGLQ